MDNFIDLTGNTTYTEAQIRKRLASIEQKTFNTRDEKVLNRVASGAALGKRTPKSEEETAIDAFAAFMEGMEVLADQIRTDNALLINTIQYEKAQQRLSKYILSEGSLAYSEEIPTGTYIFDEETGEEVPVMETINYPAIDPLPLTVTENIYDEKGDLIGTEVVDNPVVVRDVEERVAAQTIVETATQEVINLATQRV